MKLKFCSSSASNQECVHESKGRIGPDLLSGSRLSKTLPRFPGEKKIEIAQGYRTAKDPPHIEDCAEFGHDVDCSVETALDACQVVRIFRCGISVSAPFGPVEFSHHRA